MNGHRDELHAWARERPVGSRPGHPWTLGAAALVVAFWLTLIGLWLGLVWVAS